MWVIIAFHPDNNGHHTIVFVPKGQEKKPRDEWRYYRQSICDDKEFGGEFQPLRFPTLEDAEEFCRSDHGITWTIMPTREAL